MLVFVWIASLVGSLCCVMLFEMRQWRGLFASPVQQLGTSLHVNRKEKLPQAKEVTTTLGGTHLRDGEKESSQIVDVPARKSVEKRGLQYRGRMRGFPTEILHLTSQNQSHNFSSCSFFSFSSSLFLFFFRLCSVPLSLLLTIRPVRKAHKSATSSNKAVQDEVVRRHPRSCPRASRDHQCQQQQDR